MGTSFIPIAIGHFAAGWISGRPYEIVADKLFLLKKAVAESGFSIPDISDTFTRTDYFNRAQELFGMNPRQLTDYLWNTYHPSKVWIIYSGMAVAASLLLLLYDKFILKGNEVNGK
jgi:POT family proton-dependent oligopeptide transporter